MSTVRSMTRPSRRWWRETSVSAHRRALERAGWRTMLEYREHHVRDADGMLVAVESMWVAEAEWSQGDLVMSVTGATADEAWARLRQAAQTAAAGPPRRRRARTPGCPGPAVTALSRR